MNFNILFSKDNDGDKSITFEEFCKTLERIDADDKMSMKFLS